MEIKPDMNVKDVQRNGNATQKAVAEYFDKNGNGILEKEEVDCFEKSKVEKTDDGLTITNADGTVEHFEDLSVDRGEEYYSSGTIPVAVIDVFGTGWHGKTVCNMMKSENPDISITKFDKTPIRGANNTQKIVYDFLSKHPKIDAFCSQNEPFKTLLSDILAGTELAATEICLDEVIQQMKEGKDFKAVNISSGVDCSYNEINRLAGKELGVEINADNIAEYKTQIKEILESKRDETFYSTDNEKVKVGRLLDIINKMESIDAPIYVASSYERGDDLKFNFLALADNSKCVEAGKEQQDGEMKTSSHVSSNSLSIDKNTGKKRIENSIYYSKDVPYDGITGVTTSIATPIALAKDLKKTT